MINKVYIVVQLTTTENIIESVWTTEELARSACFYHSNNSGIIISKYMIVEREINKAKKR